MRARRWWLALASFVASTVVPTMSWATPRLDAFHVLGKDAPWTAGWNEAVVVLDNSMGGAFLGTVSIDARYDRRTGDRPSVRLPVTLGAGEVQRLLMPVFLKGGATPTLVLSSDRDGEVASQTLGITRPSESIATIVEIQASKPLGGKLFEIPPEAVEASDDESAKDFHLPPARDPFRAGPSPSDPEHPATPPQWKTALTPQVATVELAKESGDPTLPGIAGAWSAVVLVVAPTDAVCRLQGRQLEALLRWVTSGGTLATYVRSEDDLRCTAMRAFVGADARQTSAGGTEPMTFAGGALRRGAIDERGGEGEGDGSDGDVAPTGLGETWLLRHDPWARARHPTMGVTIYRLWADSVRRRGELVSPPAGFGPRWSDDTRVRSFLDPNENFRPSLGIAAVLVVLYALLVGPFTFYRARKAKRPMSVLRWSPALALALFASLVGVGKLARGVTGRARSLTVIDVVAGGKRGPSTTFHAFFTSDPGELTLLPKEAIDTLHVVVPSGEDDLTRIENGVTVVRKVRAHPWQTVIAAEEGATSLGEGVTIERDGADVALVNGTPWTLRHLTIHLPEKKGVSMSRYFAEVLPGAKVVSRAGLVVERRLLPPSVTSNRTDPDAMSACDAVESLLTSSPGAPATSEGMLTERYAVATALIDLPRDGARGVVPEKNVAFLRVLGRDVVFDSDDDAKEGATPGSEPPSRDGTGGGL